MSATPNQNQANTEEDKKPSADGAHINLKVKGQVYILTPIHTAFHTCFYVGFFLLFVFDYCELLISRVLNFDFDYDVVVSF